MGDSIGEHEAEEQRLILKGLEDHVRLALQHGMLSEVIKRLCQVVETLPSKDDVAKLPPEAHRAYVLALYELTRRARSMDFVVRVEYEKEEGLVLEELTRWKVGAWKLYTALNAMTELPAGVPEEYRRIHDFVRNNYWQVPTEQLVLGEALLERRISDEIQRLRLTAQEFRNIRFVLGLKKKIQLYRFQIKRMEEDHRLIAFRKNKLLGDLQTKVKKLNERDEQREEKLSKARSRLKTRTERLLGYMRALKTSMENLEEDSEEKGSTITELRSILSSRKTRYKALRGRYNASLEHAVVERKRGRLEALASVAAVALLAGVGYFVMTLSTPAPYTDSKSPQSEGPRPEKPAEVRYVQTPAKPKPVPEEVSEFSDGVLTVKFGEEWFRMRTDRWLDCYREIDKRYGKNSTPAQRLDYFSNKADKARYIKDEKEK